MGRESWSQRELVEYVPKIDIRELCLSTQPSCDGYYLESVGLEVSWYLEETIYSTDPTGVSIGNLAMERCGEIKFILYPSHSAFVQHSILRQPVNFGGYRYYFMCRTCGCAVKNLYFHDGKIGCKKCLGLVYQRSRDHRSRRLDVRSFIILMKKQEDLPSSQTKRKKRLEKRLKKLTPIFNAYIDNLHP